MSNEPVIIFQYYNRAKAEATFPLIEADSTESDIQESAWLYSLDVMNRCPDVLTDAFIGEYLDTLDDMRHYHSEVIQALADEDYVTMGKLVEDAVGGLINRTVDYIEEHINNLKGE
jgi:hypothetical protein